MLVLTTGREGCAQVLHDIRTDPADDRPPRAAGRPYRGGMTDATLPPGPPPQPFRHPAPPPYAVAAQPVPVAPSRLQVALGEFWRGQATPVPPVVLGLAAGVAVVGAGLLVGHDLGLGAAVAALLLWAPAVPALVRRRAVAALVTAALSVALVAVVAVRTAPWVLALCLLAAAGAGAVAAVQARSAPAIWLALPSWAAGVLRSLPWSARGVRALGGGTPGAPAGGHAHGAADGRPAGGVRGAVRQRRRRLRQLPADVRPVRPAGAGGRRRSCCWWPPSPSRTWPWRRRRGRGWRCPPPGRPAAGSGSRPSPRSTCWCWRSSPCRWWRSSAVTSTSAPQRVSRTPSTRGRASASSWRRRRSRSWSSRCRPARPPARPRETGCCRGRRSASSAWRPSGSSCRRSAGWTSTSAPTGSPGCASWSWWPRSRWPWCCCSSWSPASAGAPGGCRSRWCTSSGCRCSASRW